MVLMTLHTYPYALLGLVGLTLPEPHGLESARLLCPRGFSRIQYWSRLPCPPPGYVCIHTYTFSSLYIPREGNGYPLQSFCPRNTTDRGAWRATDHGGHKESDTTEHAHFIYRYTSKTRDLKHKTYIIQGGKSGRN